MIRSTSATQGDEPTTGERVAEWSEYPPPIEGTDEVSRAKLNLLQLAQPSPRSQAPGPVGQHPYGFVLAALAAGFVVGRVPMLRRLVFKVGAWGASSYAQKALRQWMGR